MKLSDILKPECVLTGVSLDSKKAALHAVAAAAKRDKDLDQVSEGKIYRALKAREALGSTGFGKGIAIPHCRMDSATAFTVGFITVPDGVKFDAMDGELVYLIFFIVGPSRETTQYIKILSCISHNLNNPETVKKIIETRDVRTACDYFKSQFQDDIDTDEQTDKNILNIFIQNREFFTPILEVFVDLDVNGVTVFEGRTSSSYLARLPLFAGMWRDRSEQFSKLIMVVVEKKITNETIRRIEMITGPLKDRTDIILTIQEPAYIIGSLLV